MYDLINHGMDLHATYAAYRDGKLSKFLHAESEFILSLHLSNSWLSN